MAVTKSKIINKEWWDKDRWCNLIDKTCKANRTTSKRITSKDLNQWYNKEVTNNKVRWVCKDKEDIIKVYNRIKFVEGYSQWSVKT